MWLAKLLLQTRKKNPKHKVRSAPGLWLAPTGICSLEPASVWSPSIFSEICLH